MQPGGDQHKTEYAIWAGEKLEEVRRQKRENENETLLEYNLR